MNTRIDISENYIRSYDSEVMGLMLFDQTSRSNIYWASDDYAHLGEMYSFFSPITPESITGDNIKVIRPRVLKAKELQSARSREMAEVFTPSWICNAQNNLIDEAWFGRKDVFNHENEDHTWTPTKDKIIFPEGKNWKDYVRDTRLEITCGEGPYLSSRYDTTTGDFIPISDRIGLLDRKLRVVSENTETSGEFLEWSQEAYMSLYGYEWQGDNLLLARESMFYSFIEYYKAKFGKEPLKRSARAIAYIISWNLWQMDGLRCILPMSCHEEEVGLDLFGSTEIKKCIGCATNKLRAHNGTYCLIKDWENKGEDGNQGKTIRFVDLINQ